MVLNQQGGLGKTTDTINLGGALAEAGRRVLLVDLDPQGNLTSAPAILRGASNQSPSPPPPTTGLPASPSK